MDYFKCKNCTIMTNTASLKERAIFTFPCFFSLAFYNIQSCIILTETTKKGKIKDCKVSLKY